MILRCSRRVLGAHFGAAALTHRSSRSLTVAGALCCTRLGERTRRAGRWRSAWSPAQSSSPTVVCRCRRRHRGTRGAARYRGLVHRVIQSWANDRRPPETPHHRSWPWTNHGQLMANRHAKRLGARPDSASDEGFRLERTTGFEPATLTLAKKVMEFVRVDGWGPLSRLSSVGSSAQSAESAPVRSRSFNALNGRSTNVAHPPWSRRGALGTPTPVHDPRAI